MMVHDDDEAEKPVSDDAVEELLDTETEDDEEIDAEAKDTVDEFGAGLDDDVKSRDWE
jgi:hypothetical protein